LPGPDVNRSISSGVDVGLICWWKFKTPFVDAPSKEKIILKKKKIKGEDDRILKNKKIKGEDGGTWKALSWTLRQLHSWCPGISTLNRDE
jgi:hypothetical protein